MRVNELDELFIINYIVGGFVFIGSLISFFVVVFFKDLFPLMFHYQHKGLGIVQGIVACVLFLVMVGSINFISMTKKYQDAYGF